MLRRRFMAIAEYILNTEWDRNGGWVTHEGVVELCDPTISRLHYEIILEHFGDYLRVDGLLGYDAGESDLAHEIAYDAGWIRIMTRGDRSISLNWERKPTAEAKLALLKFLAENIIPYISYEMEAEGKFLQFDTMKALVRAVRSLG